MRSESGGRIRGQPPFCRNGGSSPGWPGCARSSTRPRQYPGSDLTNTYAKGSYGQRIGHFTEEPSFLSESDKDWVMGRAIVQGLKWA
jgi:hypothetical protein